jgi:endogenous inhibitor of DNA gyrase (YacG/DUF329 family)
MKRRCPVCQIVVEVSPQEQPENARFFPFCSRRCKLLDLGAWLDAEYKIVGEPQSPESGEPPDSSFDIPSGQQ